MVRIAAVVALGALSQACGISVPMEGRGRNLATAEPSTLAPTTFAPTVAQTSNYPECTQGYAPPGVKPNGCLEALCYPDGLGENQLFHTSARFCLSRPRKWHMTFGLLDINTHAWYDGTGWVVKDGEGNYEEWQCGEHTFKLVFPAGLPRTGAQGQLDIMWKYFVTPVWFEGDDEEEEPFPNMIAEAGIPQQPPYTGLVNDCPIIEDLLWNLPATGEQDAIQYSIKPTCITPGQPWVIELDTHLESVATADLRVNIQIGTGGDKYLGANDIFVTESNQYGLLANTGDEYWTTTQHIFTAEQTAALTPNRYYISSFFVPAGQQYGQVPEGWTIIEREFLLQDIYLC